MSPTTSPIALLGIFAAIELIGIGGVGAWLAKRHGFSYALLAPVALLVYGAAGFAGARGGSSGAALGASVAFLDAATWALFGGLGPQPRDPTQPFAARIATVALVTGLGAGCGALGSALAG